MSGVGAQVSWRVRQRHLTVFFLHSAAPAAAVGARTGAFGAGGGSIVHATGPLRCVCSLHLTGRAEIRIIKGVSKKMCVYGPSVSAAGAALRLPHRIPALG